MDCAHLTPGQTRALACIAAGQGPYSVSTQSAPEGIRTPNLLIRSQMLYPLSYGCRCLSPFRAGREVTLAPRVANHEIGTRSPAPRARAVRTDASGTASPPP